MNASYVEIEELCLFAAGMIDAIVHDEISGEVHTGASFKTIGDTNRDAYSRSSTGTRMPMGLYSTNLSEQRRYFTREQYEAYYQVADFKVTALDRLETEVVEITSQQADWYAIYLPLVEEVQSVEEVISRCKNIAGNIESTRLQQHPVHGFKGHINRILDTDENSITLSADDKAMLANFACLYRSTIPADSQQRFDKWYGNIASDSKKQWSIWFLRENLKGFIDDMESELTCRGDFHIPILVGGIVYVVSISMSSTGFGSPPRKYELNGIEVQRTVLPRGEILGRAIGIETVVYTHKDPADLQRDLLDALDRDYNQSVDTRLPIDTTEPIDSFEGLVDLLKQLHVRTKLHQYNHEYERWRVEQLDRRMRQFFHPYFATRTELETPHDVRQERLERRITEVLDHYYDLFTTNETRPTDVLPTASGVSANSIAIQKVFKLFQLSGDEPKVYQAPGWYYESSLKGSNTVHSSRVTDVGEANVLLLAIDPNGPQINKGQKAYRERNEQLIRSILTAAESRPSEQFAIVIDKTSDILGNYGLVHDELPKNVAVFETMSLTKHQGRQAQFFGMLVQYSGQKIDTAQEELLIGARVHGDSWLMLPVLSRAAIEWQREHATHQMEYLSQKLDQLQSDAGIPEDLRWTVEVYNNYCFFIPPALALDIHAVVENIKPSPLKTYLSQVINAYPIQSAVNYMLESVWAQRDEDGNYLPHLVDTPPVDKGDSYGTERMRFTLFGVKRDGRNLVIVRCAAGRITTEEQVEELAEHIHKKITAAHRQLFPNSDN